MHYNVQSYCLLKYRNGRNYLVCLHCSSSCELRIVYTHIDQTLVNSLHGLLNCEIDGLDCHVITTEYRTHVHCIHMQHLLCNALVHVIYSGVSSQCSHTTVSHHHSYSSLWFFMSPRWDSVLCCTCNLTVVSLILCSRRFIDHEYVPEKKSTRFICQFSFNQVRK